MSDESIYRPTDAAGSVRVLFCIGVTPEFCAAPRDSYEALGGAIQAAFADLGGRFGLTVLGTFDDDLLLMGASASWPWSCYILADAPGLAAVSAVTSIVRDTPSGDGCLWRYLTVEARVGRELFFGNA
jgi:hypothetical protein